MNMEWFANPADLLAKKKDHSNLVISPLYEGPFPLVIDAVNADGTPGERKKFELAYVKAFQVKINEDIYVSTLMARMKDGKPHYGISCGDPQLTGTFKLDGKNFAAELRSAGKISSSICNALEASEWVGKVEDVTSCNYENLVKREKLCSHTQTVLAQTAPDDLVAMSTTLEQWLSGIDNFKPTAGIVEKLSPEEEAFYDAAFIQHVFLAGERGSGKTTLARRAADKYDAVYLEMQMHPSMEGWELRTHDRMHKGSVYQVMGKLAEAVYWIQQGKRVVLLMDEFLNMNPLYTTTINTPLTLTEKDTYIIETGNIIPIGENGLGRIETVEVPAEMLWVVATSNIGARYNLDKMSPSARARFLIILLNSNPDRTNAILEKKLAAYSMPLELAAMFAKFMASLNQAVDQNQMDEEATTRMAVNVMRSCYLKTKRDGKSIRNLKGWIAEVKKQVLLEIGQVVNFENGPYDDDQKNLFLGMVDAAFRVAK